MDTMNSIVTDHSYDVQPFQLPSTPSAVTHRHETVPTEVKKQQR